MVMRKPCYLTILVEPLRGVADLPRLFHSCVAEPIHVFGRGGRRIYGLSGSSIHRSSGGLLF